MNPLAGKPHIYTRKELEEMSLLAAGDAESYRNKVYDAAETLLVALGASGDDLTPLTAQLAKERRRLALWAANRLIRVAE